MKPTDSQYLHGKSAVVGRLRRVIARAFVPGVVVLLLGLMGGCGDRRLEVTPVHGQVVYRGTGIPQAVVIFHPHEEAVEQARKMRPFAYTDDQGNFELKTYVDGDGAPPGEYRVSIIANSSGAGGPRTKDSPENEQAPAGPAIRIPPEVSKKYRDVDTSGIKVTIQNGDNDLEPFVL